MTGGTVSVARGAIRAVSITGRAVSIAWGAIRAVSVNGSWIRVSTHMNSWTGMVDHRTGRVMHWNGVMYRCIRICGPLIPATISFAITSTISFAVAFPISTVAITTIAVSSIPTI